MRGIPHLSSGVALGKGSSVMNNGSGLTQWLAALEAQRDARVLIVAPGRTAGLAELEITELAEAVSRRAKRRGDASGGSGGEDGDGVEASIASYAHRCAASLKQLHAVTPGEEEVRRRLHTSDGYCEATADGDEGDCAHGHKGTYRLAPLETQRWDHAGVACMARCARCARCRFISISVRFADCSWFHDCDLASLRRDVPGFLSARRS